VVFSCSAAAAITFFLAPFWGLALLGVPIFLGVYLCIVRSPTPPALGLSLCTLTPYRVMVSCDNHRQRSPGILR
jgi:hypothetical protein